MNVLVYDGPGTSPSSVSHTLYTLRRHVGTRYAVQTISADALNFHPWTLTCVLLVFPGGRDVPYLNALPHAAPIIREYVRNGGSYLGLCAGAYFASARVEWEVGSMQEVVGDRPLEFYPGTCEGCTYKGFSYDSEAGACPVSLQPLDAYGEEIDPLNGLYYNGGGHFVDADEKFSEGVKSLMRYIGGEGDGKVAAVACKVGKGTALLFGVHIEYPLFFEPAAGALRRYHPSLSDQAKSNMENRRTAAMINILRLLRLQVKDASPKTTLPTVPLPQILAFNKSHIAHAAKFMKKVSADLSASTSGEPFELIPDQNDTFHVWDNPDVKEMLKKARQIVLDRQEPPTSFPKQIAVITGEELPDTSVTAHFNIPAFFEEIERQRRSEPSSSKDFALGDAILYGEVVTSTQTLLDRNPTLLRALPSPLVSLATFQLAGKGRGGNVWVNPAGCLVTSFAVRPPPSRDTKAALTTSSLVFIQYLAGLAITESCREILGTEAGARVRLKWPNDIYTAPVDYDPNKRPLGSRGRRKSIGTDASELKKLGGVLVSTNFSGGEVDMIVGIGLNVLNDLPTTSMRQLVPGMSLTLEHVAAVLACTFERMWDEFVAAKGSFEPFIELYLERWLHSDQLVTLTTISPPTQVRLVGITLDHGLLRTARVRTGQAQRYGQPDYIDLQPDGNSFDILAGLIKAKR